MSKLDKSRWPRVKFGDVVRQVKDVVDPRTSGLERFIAGEHMDTDELRIRRWGTINDGYLGPAFHMRFKPGQVLYGSRRTYLRKVAVPDFEGICANTTFVLEPKNPNVLDPGLLPFIMQAEAFHSHSIRQSKGSVNPYINFSDITWYEFPLPPLGEQRQLIDLVNASEEVCRAYQECIECANTLVASIRANEFDPERQDCHTLAELCDHGTGIQIGPFGAQLHQADYVEQGVPVVMPANMIGDQISTHAISRIAESKAHELSTHRLKAGDILLPRRGELDRRAYVDQQSAGWLCGTGSIRIRVGEGVSSRAVFHALASNHTVRWLNGNAVGTTMPNLNSSIVGRIPVALPPSPRLSMVVEQLDCLQTDIPRLGQRQAFARRVKSGLLTLLEGDVNGV